MSPIKPFHFEPNFEQVLRHLKEDKVCLSRLSASLSGIPDPSRYLLLDHVRACLRYDLLAKYESETEGGNANRPWLGTFQSHKVPK